VSGRFVLVAHPVLTRTRVRALVEPGLKINPTGRTLLDLPGGRAHISESSETALTRSAEIHNEIYHLVIEESLVKWQRPVRNGKGYEPTFSDGWSRHDPPLSEVCRQIRKEFLPLCPVNLRPKDVKRYIREFYPSRDPRVMADYEGTIIVDFERERYTTVSSRSKYCSSVNILPLVRLYLCATKVRCESVEWDADMVRNFFKSDNAAWRDCVINNGIATIDMGYYYDHDESTGKSSSWWIIDIFSRGRVKPNWAAIVRDDQNGARVPIDRCCGIYGYIVRTGRYNQG
jgi:hypothetical protein